MATIGYGCSHEQFAPSELLGYVRRAERAGFRAAMPHKCTHPSLGLSVPVTGARWGHYALRASVTSPNGT